MSIYIDLHTHSTASDGTNSPVELLTYALSYAKESSDSIVIALTDHDTVAGIPEFLTEAQKYASTITAIPGLEISTYRKNRNGKTQEIHILGYGIDPSRPVLLSTLQEFRKIRDSRNEKIIEKLQKEGMQITLEDICTQYPDASIGRPLIARYLMNMGYVSSIQEAFDRYLADGKSCYCDRQYPEPDEAISLIHKSGGIAVLAHPVNYKKLDREELLTLIKELKVYGLDGLEVYYSKNTPDHTDDYEHLAESFSLLATGGSDYHGENKPDISLFKGKGNLQVDEAILESFMNRMKAY